MEARNEWNDFCKEKGRKVVIAARKTWFCFWSDLIWGLTSINFVIVKLAFLVSSFICLSRKQKFDSNEFSKVLVKVKTCFTLNFEKLIFLQYVLIFSVQFFHFGANCNIQNISNISSRKGLRNWRFLGFARVLLRSSVTFSHCKITKQICTFGSLQKYPISGPFLRISYSVQINPFGIDNEFKKLRSDAGAHQQKWSHWSVVVSYEFEYWQNDNVH